jgi:hypothetical protein
MKSKLLIFGLLVAAALPGSWGCHKNYFSYNDLAGDSTIRGTVVVIDTLRGSHVPVGVGPLTVYLRYPGDTTGFLYSTVTNNLGQYVFNGIDPGQSYVVFATKDSVPLIYYGQLSYPAGDSKLYSSDTLKLYPAQLGQNGFFVQLQDSLRQPLAGAQLFVFSSQVLWQNSDSAGSIYSLTSDPFGRVVQLNVVPGTYYVHAEAQFGGLILQASGSFKVGADSITSYPLQLSANFAPYGTGVAYFVKDSTGDPLANATLYVLTSRVLWGFNDSVGGNIATLHSDANGKAVLQGIAPGEYYVLGREVVDAVVLTGKDSTKVNYGSSTPDTLVLKIGQ